MLIDRKFIYFIIINIIIDICILSNTSFSRVSFTFISILLFISLVYMILDFVPARVAECAKNMLIFASFILGMIDIFLVVNFNSAFTPYIFDSLLATTMSESGEFLSFYILSMKNIAILLGYALVNITIYIYIYIRNISFKLNKRFVYISCSVCLSALLFVVIREQIEYKQFATHTLRKFTHSTNITRYIHAISFSLHSNLESVKEMRDLKQKLSTNHIDENYIVQNNSSIKNVVIVIGESAQRNFMHSYGYYLHNTPFTDKFIKSDNLFIFKDVISPGYNTHSALEKVLTFSDYENRDIPWYKQQNILSIMRMAGYPSMWLSNQENVSVFRNSISSLASMSDFRFYTVISHEYTGLMDEALLGLYDKYKDVLKSDKKLFVFHLIGSHLIYKNRYPEGFAKFTSKDILEGIESGDGLKVNGRAIWAKDIQKDHINEARAQVVASYVNSHYCTDFVISEIIDRFALKESIIFYFSDHSQDIYQSGRALGHVVDSAYSLEIPFFVFVSDKVKNTYPEIVESIKSSINKPFMNDDFLHSLLDILGIKTVETQETKSIFNKNFNAKRERMVGGLNYDRDLR